MHHQDARARTTGGNPGQASAGEGPAAGRRSGVLGAAATRIAKKPGVGERYSSPRPEFPVGDDLSLAEPLGRVEKT